MNQYTCDVLFAKMSLPRNGIKRYHEDRGSVVVGTAKIQYPRKKSRGRYSQLTVVPIPEDPQGALLAPPQAPRHQYTRNWYSNPTPVEEKKKDKEKDKGEEKKKPKPPDDDPSSALVPVENRETFPVKDKEVDVSPPISDQVPDSNTQENLPGIVPDETEAAPPEGGSVPIDVNPPLNQVFIEVTTMDLPSSVSVEKIDPPPGAQITPPNALVDQAYLMAQRANEAKFQIALSQRKNIEPAMKELTDPLKGVTDPVKSIDVQNPVTPVVKRDDPMSTFADKPVPSLNVSKVPEEFEIEKVQPVVKTPKIPSKEIVEELVGDPMKDFMKLDPTKTFENNFGIPLNTSSILYKNEEMLEQPEAVVVEQAIQISTGVWESLYPLLHFIEPEKWVPLAIGTTVSAVVIGGGVYKRQDILHFYRILCDVLINRRTIPELGNAVGRLVLNLGKTGALKLQSVLTFFTGKVGNAAVYTFSKFISVVSPPLQLLVNTGHAIYSGGHFLVSKLWQGSLYIIGTLNPNLIISMHSLYGMYWISQMIPGYLMTAIVNNGITEFEKWASNPVAPLTNYWQNKEEPNDPSKPPAIYEKVIQQQQAFTTSPIAEHLPEILKHMHNIHLNGRELLALLKHGKLTIEEKHMYNIILKDMETLDLPIPENPLAISLRLLPYSQIYYKMHEEMNTVYLGLEQLHERLAQRDENTPYVQSIVSLREKYMLLIQEFQQASGVSTQQTKLLTDTYNEYINPTQTAGRMSRFVEAFRYQVGTIIETVFGWFEFMGDIVLKSLLKYFVQYFTYALLAYATGGSGVLLGVYAQVGTDFLQIFLNEVIAKILGGDAGFLAYMGQLGSFVYATMMSEQGRKVTELYEYPIPVKNPYDPLTYIESVMKELQQNHEPLYEKIYKGLDKIKESERNEFIKASFQARTGPTGSIRTPGQLQNAVEFDYNRLLQQGANNAEWMTSRYQHLQGANDFLAGNDPVVNPTVFSNIEQFQQETRNHANAAKGTLPANTQGFRMSGEKINELGDIRPNDNGPPPPTPPPSSSSTFSSPENPSLGIFGQLLQWIKEKILQLWNGRMTLLKGASVWVFLTVVQMGVNSIVNAVFDKLKQHGRGSYQTLKELVMKWFMESTETVSLGDNDKTVHLTPAQLADAYNQYRPVNMETNAAKSMLFEVGDHQTVDYAKGFNYLCYGAFAQVCIEEGIKIFYNKIVPIEHGRTSYDPMYGDQYNQTVPHVSLEATESIALMSFFKILDESETSKRYTADRVAYHKYYGRYPEDGESFSTLTKWDWTRIPSNIDDPIRLGVQSLINTTEQTDAYNQQVFNAAEKYARNQVTSLDAILATITDSPMAEEDINTEFLLFAYRNATAIAESISYFSNPPMVNKQNPPRVKKENPSTLDLWGQVGDGHVAAASLAVMFLFTAYRLYGERAKLLENLPPQGFPTNPNPAEYPLPRHLKRFI